MSEQNKIDEIKEAVESYLRDPSVVKREVFRANAPEYITYLLAEIERKDEALRFYADERNNENIRLYAGYDSNVKQDGGKRAREAL